MDGLPVTIRLIDPHLHEFLPSHDEPLRSVAETEMHIAADLKDPITAPLAQPAANCWRPRGYATAPRARRPGAAHCPA